VQTTKERVRLLGVAWSLWRERNRRVHDFSALQLVALLADILAEARR
jgi:hypothetical protein